MIESCEQAVLLGSHEFLDQLALAYHRAIAVRLLTRPNEVLRIAEENLQRWQQVHAGTGTLQAVEEWKTLLATNSLPELAAILTEDSEEGQRLRQSTPFPGVLSKEEREEIFARCEKGIFD
jgi:hypothetical protein